MNVVRYLYGKWNRLHFGFCPICNSSPPDENCSFCHGDRGYGRHTMDAAKLIEWKARWRLFYKLKLPADTDLNKAPHIAGLHDHLMKRNKG